MSAIMHYEVHHVKLINAAFDLLVSNSIFKLVVDKIRQICF